MATGKSPAPRARRSPIFVANIGNVGRRTGIMMAERERDEHGMERADGWFSPTPGKPTEKRATTRSSNGTLDLSESMELSSGQSPAQFTSSKRGLNGKERIDAHLLSVMRSPIKSNLGGSPRRQSILGASSPSQPAPLPIGGRPIVRKLFGEGQVQRSSYSPASSQSRGGQLNGSALRNSQNIYDLPSPEEDDTVLDGGGGMDDDDMDITTGAGDQSFGGYDGDDLDDNGYISGQNEDQQQTEEEIEAQEQSEEQETRELSARPPTPVARKRGRPKKVLAPEVVADTQPEIVAEMDVQEDEEEAGDMPPPQAKRPRGRPPKADKANGGPLASKSTNAKLKAPKTAKKNEQSTNNGRQRIRYQTPMDDDEVSVSRAGRHIYKPLHYWKGEHAIFEEHTLNTSLKEIIRVDDATPVKRKRTYTGSKSRRRKRTYSVFEDDLDDDGFEPWENEDDGVVVAPVRQWDQERGNAPPEDEAEQKLAFAAPIIRPQPAADNPNFMFTKNLTMPFFGAGVIELPPEGMKGMKNSRRFQFVFFVSVGKVAVEINGTRFVISKGGMWQVPRGNFYSITNESDHTAKIFFAQGAEMAAQRDVPNLHSME